MNTTPRKLNGKSILVVDDQPAILSSIAAMLEIHGCATHQCSNGTEALEQMEKLDSKIDCIVLDYSLPGMNGLQFLQAIRGQGYSVPVIMCSGLPLKRDANKTASWPNEILSKPFQLQILLDKISVVCEEWSNGLSAAE